MVIFHCYVSLPEGILKFGSKHCSNCSLGHWQAWLRLALTSLIILGAYAIRVRHAMKTAGADGVRWSPMEPWVIRGCEFLRRN